MEVPRVEIFLVYLSLTIVLETPVLIFIGRRWLRWSPAILPTRYLVGAGIVCSASTYPYLWFVLPAILGDYVAVHVVGELLIVVVEAMILYGMLRISWAHALTASIGCNATTIGVGLCLNRWEPWRHLMR